jgi:hypothetical protein
MRIPNTLPAWMTEPEPTSSPSWCRGGAEAGWTSTLPTGASSRTLATPTVKIGRDVSLHLHQDEQSLHGHLTHTPITVRLWGHDGDLSIDLTDEQAQALGVAMIEHAAHLREVQA